MVEPMASSWSPSEWKRTIRQWGLELGFTRVGFAAAIEPRAREHLLEWLARGFHGSMSWMARDPASRCDPQAILPGMRSCVVAALQYHHPDPVPLRPGAPRISRYAWGEDYHAVVQEKLRALDARIRAHRPALRSRIACDTSPVMDKAWAQAAGLGWQGRNTCLIHPDLGSWFFLGEIFLDLELPPDHEVADHCGTCTRCLDVCPTGALPEPYVLDSRRCISYLTIERRGDLTPDEALAIGEWLVGCDLCQDVCPWNRDAPISTEIRFRPRPDLAARPTAEWALLEDEEYRRAVQGTAITRIKPAEMRRNAAAVGKNAARREGADRAATREELTPPEADR
jgi:epoxyqueuosine reductase